ncbi:MAG: prepilin-type N-terminal cleavage/methylation domain-containing protein [Acetobacterium sp.]|nr:prepilin-type N-terminal cleavage/methylation domain-containing protein [Acetobacterium woodii]MBU4440282.1 prepilin-type N-terminal cleavage/methylation domain-containing protein [Bacillota bacterium]MCG2729247.1 prepilin-type N-terminal cleavage/methylation domain-containing protein [Acetobacterium sp.]
MRHQILRKNQGFSLIEVLTSLMVISLVLGLLLSGLIFVNTIKEKTQINQKLFYSERYLNLYFQKQILKSETIYFVNNRIYLQDMENPDLYYNYYQYNNGFLRRYKVYKNGLNPIGSGGNSQFADNIKSFSLTLGANKEILLNYTLAIDGEIYQRETTIKHGRTVVIL